MTPFSAEPHSLAFILGKLLRDPYAHVLRRWNWKSALLSAVMRAIVFFTANLSAGLGGAASAASVDILFRITTSGFHGGVTQALRRAEPAWHGAAASLVLLPACNHSVEFLIHRAHGTPRLKASMVASICVTAVSALFNWYAMRRGALLASGEGDSLGRDMARMPAIVAGFVAAGPLSLWRAVFTSSPRRRT